MKSHNPRLLLSIIKYTVNGPWQLTGLKLKAADIGTVESYKYLGVVLDHKLCFDAITKSSAKTIFKEN